MMKKNILRIVPHMLAVTVGIIWFLYYDRQANKAIEKANSEFVLLNKAQSIKSKVIELYCPPELNCAPLPIFLILEGGIKIAVNARQDLTNSTTLRKTVSVGDSIIKKPGTDIVLVKKKGQGFEFLISEDY